MHTQTDRQTDRLDCPPRGWEKEWKEREGKQEEEKNMKKKKNKKIQNDDLARKIHYSFYFC